MIETMQSPASFESAAANRVVMVCDGVLRVMPGDGEFPQGVETMTAEEWARQTGLGLEAVRNALRYGIVPESE